MEEILSIQSPVAFDESIAHYEIHAHKPYTSSFNNTDEIRILIQHQDLCLLPSRSVLRICGQLTNVDGTRAANTRFVNNGVCHLFDEIRYEINAVEIDRCKNVGLTSIMKGWTSFKPTQSSILENAGWLDVAETKQIANEAGYFDVSIPLSMLLGFAEDYHKIIVNVKHELIFTRSSSDSNAIIQTPIMVDNRPTYDGFKITLEKIEWLMPYVVVSDINRVRLLSFIEKDRPVAMGFRSWELYEYPLLPMTSEHVWTVKTSNQLEKPRFIILAFQTARKNSRSNNASHFDHCNIRNVKLYLNSQCYPYSDLNLDINSNQYSILYNMFANFQTAYYGREAEPMLNKHEFINTIPLIVIDCSKQNESIKNAPVDVRLQFESRGNFPANTSAYCLILHDRVVHYTPVSGEVKKLI